MHDVAVIGAGIAGSSLAKVLADLGWDTVLIDQDTFPRNKVCGEFLSPESQQILAALRLDETLRALGPACMDKTKLTLAGGATLELPLPGTAFGISRFALDYALHEAVRKAGGTILLGTAVTTVEEAPKGYRVGVRKNEEPILARAVIAAWGRNRRSSLLGPHIESSRHHTYIGVKTHLEGIRSESAVELYFYDGGYLGISAIEDGRHNLAALYTPMAFNQAGKTIHGAIELAASRNPTLRQRLIEGRFVSGTQAATSPVITNRQPVPWDHIPHIGDASMMIPPICGDGMAMALFSAQLCAAYTHEYLNGRMTVEEWRRSYTQTLLREISSPIRWGRMVQHLLGSPVLSRIALGIGSLAPAIAYQLVKQTRLKKK